jgi:hypothetical protein
MDRGFRLLTDVAMTAALALPLAAAPAHADTTQWAAATAAGTSWNGGSWKRLALVR